MRYTLTKGNKTLPFVLIGLGLLATIFGFVTNPHKTWADLLLGNFYFMAIALAGTFFLAVQYVAEVGWSAGLIRVFQAFGAYIPLAGGAMLLIFVLGHHDLYHWTHSELYDKNSPEFDPILNGKHGYLNVTFFIIRMIVYFLIWILLTNALRRESIQEDLDGEIRHHKKMIRYSAMFLVLFLITSSTSAWDFIMSLDPHWFSTLFGWYTFASLFVSGLAMMTLVTIYLKKQGYMEHINENHLHDLGKFMFAFSIFWTYLWFAQFMLIWYANLPEEIAYFLARFHNYKGLFIANFSINFFIPFLSLMSRDSKRKQGMLIFVACMILVGHWIDMFLMIMPPTVGANWSIGITEIGCTALFGGIFLWAMLGKLSKAPLVPQKHPMLDESYHFHL